MILDNGVYREYTEEEIKKIEEQEKHQYDDMPYEEIVIALIRKKYTVDDELALHRQRNIKIEEFNLYNLYCEECKLKAKKITEGA